VPFHNVNTGEN
jgi:hypothetical protein